MSEQVQSAEERARVVIDLAAPYTNGVNTIEPDVVIALKASGLTIIDTAELAQLRADLDAAMRFAEAERIAGRYKPPVLGVPKDLAQEMSEARIALAPALDRWRQQRMQEDK